VILQSRDLFVLSAAMEHVAAPTLYLQDPRRIDAPLFECIKVQLALPVEDFLIHSWNWSDLRRTMIQTHQPEQCAFAGARCLPVIVSN
jgi:hypothetical protein